MQIPFLSTTARPSKARLERRKGGGKSSIGKFKISGTSRTISKYGKGSGKVNKIQSGTFAGRTEGGGKRTQIYGTWEYGSGYPGLPARDVRGRSFPFYYRPVIWGNGDNSGSYLYNTSEYGKTNDTDRLGGALMTALFLSNDADRTIFRILADNDTVLSLITDITSSCTSNLTAPADKAADFIPDQPPMPEQVIQYYRASSVALALDGYNNTAVFAPDNTTAKVPLPGNINPNLLNCLNKTIGALSRWWIPRDSL
ncbi:hypothetical protein DFH09DRAFT_1396041 [Mycena vulgaris]|nr:hypothetical protein DFH09DRAFT_1396041 [Mycena vulgaris]